MIFIRAFLAGGAICAAAQIIIDKTRLTPGRILSFGVVLGVVLTALGLYEPFVSFAGAGATVPILGFGYTMAKGVSRAVAESGIPGAFTGGFSSAAGGIGAAVFFSLVFSLFTKPGDNE